MLIINLSCYAQNILEHCYTHYTTAAFCLLWSVSCFDLLLVQLLLLKLSFATASSYFLSAVTANPCMHLHLKGHALIRKALSLKFVCTSWVTVMVTIIINMHDMYSYPRTNTVPFMALQ